MRLAEIPIEQLSFSAYRLAVEGDTARKVPCDFLSLAHWYEAERFRAFEMALFQEVLMSPSIREARKLGQKNRKYWRGDWLAVQVRALACGMVYAARCDALSERWAGNAQDLARMLGSLEFPERLALAAASEFTRQRQGKRIAFLGAPGAPAEVVGRRVNLVHKKAEGAWQLAHWLGRHASWIIHDWAVKNFIPITYFGEEQGRISTSLLSKFPEESDLVIIFEMRKSKCGAGSVHCGTGGRGT